MALKAGHHILKSYISALFSQSCFSVNTYKSYKNVYLIRKKMPCSSLNYCHGDKWFIILSAVYCKLVKILDCGPTWYIFPLSSLGYNLTHAWYISAVYTRSILFSSADNKSSQKMLLLWKVCKASACQLFKRLGYDYFYNSKRKK